MGLIRFPRRRVPDDPPQAEHEVVQEYRRLLATAPTETLVVLHEEALSMLDPLVRLLVCGTAETVVGGASAPHDELVPDDPRRQAEQVVQAATQQSSAFLDRLEDGVRHRLAQAVTHSQPSSSSVVVNETSGA
jgi:hypothetical protein